MKALDLFLIKPYNGRAFDNVKKIAGVDFVLDTNEDNHKYTNRFAVIVETPLGYKGDVQIGDTVVVHHNTFRHHYNMQGAFQKSTFHLKDNMFWIAPDDFFLYKKNGSWVANDRYCFVKPTKMKPKTLSSVHLLEPLTGEMVYPNKYLDSLGVKKGDVVVFTPDSEYEFIIDGEILYRVYDHQIAAKLN